MGQHRATIDWQRGEQPFTDRRFSRAHEWRFDGGMTVPASAAPAIVPFPYSVAANVDPEEAFVAALASCHMLFFLHLAAERGLTVDRYLDHAIGTLDANDQGRQAITEVRLRPEVRFSGEARPDEAQIQELHRIAHEHCFIANSVKTRILIETQPPAESP